MIHIVANPLLSRRPFAYSNRSKPIEVPDYLNKATVDKVWNLTDFQIEQATK
jgi:hypothetical protein